MSRYLDFKKAQCKDCYKCLRECPVKAIDVKEHQAKIIDDRCILCGRCTHVCPQNAKKVHSDRDRVAALLQAGDCVASVAPSFISSFGVEDFSVFKLALGKLGFRDAEETAVGAKVVVGEYRKLLENGKYPNLITSSCPAVNRMIQLYYPKALPFLAPVDSPMLAHAKILKQTHPGQKIVFIGPCIAKKQEADESGLVDGALTFEDLKEMFAEKGVRLDEIVNVRFAEGGETNRARFFPISRGIIKSFDKMPEGYEYVAVDGVKRCADVLGGIDKIKGVFLEINACEYACVNGPCSLTPEGGALSANAAIRRYVAKDLAAPSSKPLPTYEGIDFHRAYPRMRPGSFIVTERDIREILAKTGKMKPEDELNCGACGYNTCREKAWAVANGYADIDICLPYMRERAESMSYEIIHNSPNGIVVADNDLKIIDANRKAGELFGFETEEVIGKPMIDVMDPTEFLLAVESDKSRTMQFEIAKTGKHVDMTVLPLKGHKVVFGVLKDITASVDYNEKLDAMRIETLETTDAVIKKQMRVAQEIASLLGETTAETKVALLKLKGVLSGKDEGRE